MPHTPTLSESRVRSTAVGLHAGTLSSETLRHESDDRLVALTRGGSERAFAEITRRYQRPLRSYCSRLVGVERAQDAVQQALLQAFLALRDGAFREIALRPWLYRIAHNCSIDLLRMGSWEYEQLDLEFDGVPQPPALFEQKEELRGLVARMRRLPDAQRQALTLRELEGCSYEEISARLGHTGSGVRQLIFRARTTLRKGAAALLLPFGLVRDRVAGMAPAVDTHQMAGMAAVPASSGSGLDTVGAAALAVVAVLGGVAGGVHASHQDQRRPATIDHAYAGTTSATVRPVPFSAPRAADSDSDSRRRVPSRRGGGTGGSAPVAPLAQAAVPAPQPAVTPSVTPPAAPASDPGPADAAPTSAPEPASGDEAAVEQQALLPEPTDGGTAGGAVPELPQDGGQSAEPSSPGAAPQSGEAAPRSLTKLRSAAAARR